MKTIALHFHKPGQSGHADTGFGPGRVHIPGMVNSLRVSLAVLCVVMVATVLVTFSVWLSGQGMASLSAATTWGVGLLLFAAAVDSGSQRGYLSLLIGVALLVSAWMQYEFSPDYVIASGVLLAIWVSAAVGRRLL